MIAQGSFGDGLRHHKEGRLDEAVACYYKAIELNPGHPEAHSNLGMVLHVQGRLLDALACYRKAVELRPDYPEAQSNLGVALQERGCLAQAAACFRLAIELNPAYPEAHFNLGVVLQEQGELDNAESCYRKALDINPDYVEAQSRLAATIQEQAFRGQRAEQPYVLAFVGQNANGILRWWTEQILDRLAEFGYSSDVIDLLQPDWTQRVVSLLREHRPSFCFSFQGFGMDVWTDANIWVRDEIPFFSYLGDSPYHAPKLHMTSGPGIYQMHASADFLTTYVKYMPGGLCAMLHPPGYPANPLADDVPWAAREHDLVYVKTGVNPNAILQRWETLPRRIREIQHSSAAAVLAGSTDIIADVCASACKAANFWWGDQRELFFSICSEVDLYVRAARAERMVRFLMQRPALIFGDWSHLDCTGSQARFCGTIDAGELNRLYANTKVLVSTSPSVRHGIHERIMAGLFSKCVVMSDSTPYLCEFFAEFPAFRPVDIDAAGFEQQADEALRLPDDCSLLTAISHDLACQRLSLDHFIRPMLENLEIEHYRRTLGFFRQGTQ